MSDILRSYELPEDRGEGILQRDCNIAAQSPWIVGISNRYEAAVDLRARFRWFVDFHLPEFVPQVVEFGIDEGASRVLGVDKKADRLVAVLAQTGLESFSSDQRVDAGLAAQSIHIAAYRNRTARDNAMHATLNDMMGTGIGPGAAEVDVQEVIPPRTSYSDAEIDSLDAAIERVVKENTDSKEIS